MPTFFCKLQVTSFYSSLIQPTQNCATDRQNLDRHTYEIKYVRFRRYFCISFAIFLLHKKYIAQLNKKYLLETSYFSIIKKVGANYFFAQILVRISFLFFSFVLFTPELFFQIEFKKM